MADTFSWICDGKLELGSYCIQRTAIEGVNLLFLCIFCLLLLVSSIWKHHSRSIRSRDYSVFVFVSVCCGLTGFAYFVAGLLNLIAMKDRHSHGNLLIYVVRVLVWMSFTVSLLHQLSKWITILNSFWWLTYFSSFSAVNIEILVRSGGIQITDIVQWFVNFLLLICAFKNMKQMLSESRNEDNTLAQPLMAKKVEKSTAEPGQASFFSKLSFSWIGPLLGLGYSKPLSLEDVPPLVSEDEANLAYQKFAQAWDSISRDNNTKNIAFWAIAKVYMKENISIGIYAFLKTISVAVAPLILYSFISYANREENLYEGFFVLGCLIVSKVVESLSQRHWFFKARRCGMRMRSALMVAVYQKQIKLSSLGRRRHSTGEVVNYVAVDAYRMGEFPWWFHSAWNYVLQLLLAIGVLFWVLGSGALFGLVPFLICGLLNVPFAKKLQKCQFQCMVAQDERLRSTSETLNGMKIIKLQSWEEKFKNSIESGRETEFKWLAEAQMKKVYGTLLFWMSPIIVSSAVFVGCVILKSAPLDASTIFTVLATLRSLGEPVRMIPESLSAIIQVKVSFDRLNAFLLDDEIKDDGIRRYPVQQDSEKILKIQGGIFSWDPESTIPTLPGMDLEITLRQKIAVCGPVGAGKSSLLYAMLGEIPKISGTVDVFGSIAYVSQTAWIQSGTVRDNILYGKPMDKEKYEKAIKACALDKDINSFNHGDLTEIGQRGINMSGGQKQRIQLARAVYNGADIYLLDDPFSAVDAHTAATLFNDCVMAALEKKTVILVTHQVEFLSEVDKILVMEGGQITQSGSYEELLKAGTAFEQLVNAHRDAISTFGPSNSEGQGEVQKGDSIGSEENYGSYPAKENSERDNSLKGVTGVQLTEEEEKEIGDVGWKPFKDYIFVAKGLVLLISVIITQSGFFCLQAAASYWLAVATKIPNITSAMLIGIYSALSSLSAVFVFLRSFLGVLLGLRASKAFFSGFTNSIFKAPMLFFDSTPVGRILTRASSDMSILDNDIPFSIIFCIVGAVELTIAIVIMAYVTWPVLIVAILTLVVINYVQGYYLATARELIRINGTTKAPITNYVSETSLGAVTIRAFRSADRFFQNYLKLIDTDAGLFFYSNAALEWAVLRVELLQCLTLFTAAFLIVLLPKGYIAPGLVGFSLSYALTLTGMQIFLTRWYCNLSNYMISVERMKQFMHIPAEPPAIIEGKRPPSSWPTKGRIELHSLEIKYRPNAPLVLKGITCTFKEGTRVGVVGRTGSGKTTLISALFRLVEPTNGKIIIDRLDICSIGLKDLRMKLSIIPQEPTLFKGSIRTNLDPLGLYSDDEIWMALEKCQLKTVVSSLPNLLDSSVSDEGENWSAGQRQLFCLGRVLLKRNRILVLDEATASIDSATDAILQRIIRQEFSECTVITVAHRVPTVIDSDMVMVLSYGKLVEYDEPSALLDANSYFSKLVAEYWSSCRRSS